MPDHNGDAVIVTPDSTSPASEAVTLIRLLRATPLYEGHGEGSDLPERIIDCLEALTPTPPQPAPPDEWRDTLVAAHMTDAMNTRNHWAAVTAPPTDARENAVDGLRAAIALAVRKAMQAEMAYERVGRKQARVDYRVKQSLLTADAILATLSHKDASPPDRRPAADLEAAAYAAEVQLGYDVYLNIDVDGLTRSIAAALGITFTDE